MDQPQTQKLTMKKVKDCKHSVVFEATEKDAIIDRVYVRRPFSTHLHGVEITVNGLLRPPPVETGV